MRESEPGELESKLREANRSMRHILETMASSSSVKPANQIAQLREVLRMIRECFSNAQAQGGPALSQEIRLYRENLQKLQEAIPGAQVQLEIKRGNLERSRRHQEAVSDWFRAQDNFRP